MRQHTTETIVAVATPPGRGGIGIVRLSGPATSEIGQAILSRLPAPREARFGRFRDTDGFVIDEGVALWFPAPRSFTGEPVLELHGHGSPVVMEMLLGRCLQLGARLARPGEFSERAFLNGKLDLTQAEAVADLIEADTEAAARSAVRSLQGEFSDRVHRLSDGLTELRTFVEAAIDFPDEEIDFLADGQVLTRLEVLQERIRQLEAVTRQGTLLRDGIRLVLTGPPNAGKSSLLNALSRDERAIVSHIPGTTRDLLQHQVEIDGLAIHLIDTAGLRDNADEIEAEGIRRARDAQQQADLILLIVDDATTAPREIEALQRNLPPTIPCLTIRNKIDLSGRAAGATDEEVAISIHNGAGMEALRSQIKVRAGYQTPESGQILARQRHLDALRRAEGCLDAGKVQLQKFQAGELLAEELALAQAALGEITGEVTSNELLGRIFSSFCIGK